MSPGSRTNVWTWTPLLWWMSNLLSFHQYSYKLIAVRSKATIFLDKLRTLAHSFQHPTMTNAIVFIFNLQYPKMAKIGTGNMHAPQNWLFPQQNTIAETHLSIWIHSIRKSVEDMKWTSKWSAIFLVRCTGLNLVHKTWTYWHLCCTVLEDIRYMTCRDLSVFSAAHFIYIHFQYCTTTM